MINILEEFGQQIITGIRDNSYEEFLMIKNGTMKSEEARKMFAYLSSFDISDNKDFDKFMLEIINRVIFNLLITFEQSEDFTFAVKRNIGEEDDIVELSDGLSGELFGESGWFNKFSKI